MDFEGTERAQQKFGNKRKRIIKKGATFRSRLLALNKFSYLN